MFKNMSYNQRKLTRLIASIVLICALIFEFFAKNYLSSTFLDVIVLLALILSIVCDFTVPRKRHKTNKILLDEMAIENEAKAAQFTNSMIIQIFCIVLLAIHFSGKDIMLSYNMLLCIMIAVPAINDGYYLYLERGNHHADTDDED